MTIAETPRLYLRQITPADSDALFAIFSDPHAMRFFPGTRSRQETNDWISWQLESYRKIGFGLWAVVLREGHSLAGYSGLIHQTDVDGLDEMEIAYGFRTQLWNRGYATEAARACLKYAQGHLGKSRLVSLVAPGNISAIRVAQKVGMIYEKDILRWGKRFRLLSIDRSGSNALSFRAAQVADSEFVFQTKKAALGRYIELTWGWQEEKQRGYHQMEFEPRRITIIQCAGHDIGWYSIVAEADHIRINAIYIQPEYQGRGIGSRLIRDVFVRADALGMPVRAQVLRLNPARRLYERLGFVQVGETTEHYSMQRDVPPSSPASLEQESCAFSRTTDTKCAVTAVPCEIQSK